MTKLQTRAIQAAADHENLVGELVETMKNMASTIERQLALIAERAPGDFLDKRPVVRSLTSHMHTLRKALAKAEAQQ